MFEASLPITLASNNPRQTFPKDCPTNQPKNQRNLSDNNNILMENCFSDVHRTLTLTIR
jgi:hypothetical protein